MKGRPEKQRSPGHPSCRNCWTVPLASTITMNPPQTLLVFRSLLTSFRERTKSTRLSLLGLSSHIFVISEQCAILISSPKRSPRVAGHRWYPERTACCFYKKREHRSVVDSKNQMIMKSLGWKASLLKITKLCFIMMGGYRFTYERKRCGVFCPRISVQWQCTSLSKGQPPCLSPNFLRPHLLLWSCLLLCAKVSQQAWLP